jgi:hypothetical protein
MDNKLEGLDKQEFRTAQTISEHYGQVGTIGLERYGGYIYEEFLPNLRMPQSLKIYREMASNDPTVGAVLFIFESMMKKLTWEVKAGGDRRVDKYMADFVEECMNDMEHSWLEFIVEVLSMFTYGWSWHEIVYKKREQGNSKFSDGRIGWAKLPVRSQNSWNRWVYDEKDPDKLIGMEQNAPNTNKIVVIPYEKSLLFRTKVYRNSPEGVSLLRTAYRSWHFKKRIEEFEGIGIETDLAGIPTLTVPEGVDIWQKDNPDAVQLKSNLEKLISNLRVTAYKGLLFPFGYTFELKSTTGSRKNFDTTQIIGRYDQRIAMTMLADIILMGVGNTGSFALADTKLKLLGSALEAQADNIVNIINTIAIPKLIRLNTFEGYTEFPKLVRGEIETPDLAKLSDAMTKLNALGMSFFPNENAEDYLRNCLGLPKMSDEEKKKLEEEKKKQEAEQKKMENQKVKGLTPRQSAEHVTDNKAPYNKVYEKAGLKKFLDLFRRKEEE